MSKLMFLNPHYKDFSKFVRNFRSSPEVSITFVLNNRNPPELCHNLQETSGALLKLQTLLF